MIHGLVIQYYVILQY